MEKSKIGLYDPSSTRGKITQKRREIRLDTPDAGVFMRNPTLCIKLQFVLRIQ